MTNKVRKRIRDLRARRPDLGYQAAGNVVHRQGTEAPLAIRCDICLEPLFGTEGDAMIQWLCQLQPDERVAALLFTHKGPCDAAVQRVARALDLSSLWEEGRAIVSPEGHRNRQAVEKLYAWSRVHERRLRRLFEDVAIANKHGWRLPRTSSWSASWSARISPRELGTRVARTFATDSPALDRAVTAMKAAGMPTLDEYFASVFAE